MFKSMRRRINYANVTATLALFFAMSGGALAAKHYLLNSTKQISPKVLKALKGHVGAKGAVGAAGAAGATGAAGAAGATGAAGAAGKEGAGGKEGKEGAQGVEGPLVSALPSGKTLKGAFGGGTSRPGADSDILIEGSISFAFPLAKQPLVEVIQKEASPTAHCPGNPAAPSAAAGYLCLYVAVTEGAAPKEVHTFNPAFPEGEGYRYGAVVYTHTTCTLLCDVSFWGTWAVTAP